MHSGYYIAELRDRGPQRTAMRNRIAGSQRLRQTACTCPD